MTGNFVCTGYPRERFAAVRLFVLLTGQYLNFGLISTVNNVLELFPKQNIRFLCQEINETYFHLGGRCAFC